MTQHFENIRQQNVNFGNVYAGNVLNMKEMNSLTWMNFMIRIVHASRKKFQLNRNHIQGYVMN